MVAKPAIAVVAAPLILVVTASQNATPITGRHSLLDFQSWGQSFGKAYESDEEHLHRFGVWSANLDAINEHNAKAAQGLLSFWLKMNEFGDLTPDEYQSKLLGFEKSGKRASSGRTAHASTGTAPPSWDWRSEGIVTPVKNQAQCGSCWAFSAVAAMEGAFNLHSNGTVPNSCSQYSCGSDAKPCCSFSEQELVDCSNHGKSTCNTGGNPSDGIDYIAKDMSGHLDTETEYPYTSGGGVSRGICRTKEGSGVTTQIIGFTSVPENDETALLEAVYSHSIISIGIDASHSSFQFYGGGIYVEPKCSSTDLDHGVAIVGYGTYGPSPGPSPGPAPGPSPTPGPWDCILNENEDSCEAEAGCNWCTSLGGWCSDTPCIEGRSVEGISTSDGDYWIVRNSWGTSWGMDGYVLMARNRDNQCGVATDAVYANAQAVSSPPAIVV